MGLITSRHRAALFVALLSILYTEFRHNSAFRLRCFVSPTLSLPSQSRKREELSKSRVSGRISGISDERTPDSATPTRVCARSLIKRVQTLVLARRGGLTIWLT